MRKKPKETAPAEIKIKKKTLVDVAIQSPPVEREKPAIFMPEFVDEPKSRVKSALEAIKLLDAIETQVTQVELEIKEEK